MKKIFCDICGEEIKADGVQDDYDIERPPYRLVIKIMHETKIPPGDFHKSCILDLINKKPRSDKGKPRKNKQASTPAIGISGDLNKQAADQLAKQVKHIKAGG